MAKKRRRWRKWLGIGLITLAVLLTVDYFTFPNVAAGGQSHHQGRDGIWLRYKWYFGEGTGPEIRALARNLKAHGIKDAYFHVRYAKKDGTLNFKYPVEARLLNATFKDEYPEARSFAWFFVGNERINDNVDISNPDVRKNLVAEAVWLVNEAGFDAIQWDYEICPDGDPHLIKLLEETRAALPGTFMSVCSPSFYPVFGWSEDYFSRVAKLCDQIAVMAYDTGFFMPRHYAWMMQQQVIGVTKAVYKGNPDCEVIIGIPTYYDGPKSHHPHAENIRMALKGVREGLASGKAETRAFAGVAIFADYTTDASEWRDYRRLWVGLPDSEAPKTGTFWEQD